MEKKMQSNFVVLSLSATPLHYDHLHFKGEQSDLSSFINVIYIWESESLKSDPDPIELKFAVCLQVWLVAMALEWMIIII